MAQGWKRYTLRYTYDEKNAPVGFRIREPGETQWRHYYFVKNAQGDVMAMYRWHAAGSSSLVCTYTYDPWGKSVVRNSNGTVFNPTLNHVINYNPFRYRGYYYDIDTELYYLQSRYYDPAIGRFVSSDAFASTGQGLLGYNMFAYCGNNPVNYADPSGLMHDDLFFGKVKRENRTQAPASTAGAVDAAQPGKKLFLNLLFVNFHKQLHSLKIRLLFLLE